MHTEPANKYGEGQMKDDNKPPNDADRYPSGNAPPMQYNKHNTEDGQHKSNQQLDYNSGPPNMPTNSAVSTAFAQHNTQTKQPPTEGNTQ